MHGTRRAGLEWQEDWDMQEKLQAAMAWCTCIVTGKGERSLPAVAERILCSISAQKKYISKSEGEK